MKIELNNMIYFDSVIYIKNALQSQLTTKQLVEFVMELGNNLTHSEEYYRLLKKKLDKLKL